MGVLLIAVLLPFLAQSGQIDDKDVYKVERQDGTSYFAERTDNNENQRSYKLRPIVLDSSGEITVGSVVQVMRDEVKIIPSTLKIASESLQEEDKLRYRTVAGQRVPVEEFKLAKRAQEKAIALEESLATPDPVIEVTAVSTEPANTAATNPVVIWGPQVGLVLAAAVVIGIIVKIGILAE
jgi:hypothetical protein